MQQKATFLTGSILKHVITMSATNAIGLTAIFVVDLVDIYFISLLENSIYTAAIGYASAVLFFTTAISIGLTTANSAIVSKLIVQNKKEKAKKYVSHIAIITILITLLLTLIVWFSAPLLLSLIGADDKVLIAATAYLRIMILSLPILALSMQMSATLRSIADGKRAMHITLFAGIINALLDPILIFVFEMELQGAAIASILARICALGLALFYIINKYKMLGLPDINKFINDSKLFISIALPAMLTQIATPLGNLYVTYEVAKFGTDTVAGWAIIGRVIPVAFAMMFAISGAIGPIIGQNYGAQNFQRLRKILIESVKFTTTYCLVIALLLSLSQELIIDVFNAKNETAQIIRIFCQHIAITFIFTGITFIAMAFLNNLGYAKYATLLNIAKVTLGTMPFVTIGAYFLAAPGILYGQALGTIVFGGIALTLTQHIMKQLEAMHIPENNDQYSSN